MLSRNVPNCWSITQAKCEVSIETGRGVSDQWCASIAAASSNGEPRGHRSGRRYGPAQSSRHHWPQPLRDQQSEAGPGLASPLDTSVTTVKLCVSTKHPPSLPPPDTGSGQDGAAYWRAVSAARARARPPPDPVSAISIYLCVFTPGNIHRVYLGYWTSLHSLTSQHHQHQEYFLLKLHFSNHLQIQQTNKIDICCRLDISADYRSPLR